MIDKTNIPNETMIDGSKIVIENGEVRTILSEEIQKADISLLKRLNSCLLQE